jgi:hypothetical protein
MEENRSFNNFSITQQDGKPYKFKNWTREEMKEIIKENEDRPFDFCS